MKNSQFWSLMGCVTITPHLEAWTAFIAFGCYVALSFLSRHDDKPA